MIQFITEAKKAIKPIVISVLSLFILTSSVSCNKDLKIEYPTPDLIIDLPDTGFVSVPFFASNNGYFYKNTGDNKGKLIYITGVDIGFTEPGTDLSSPDISYDTYMRWFSYISQMNANTVRVFSVMNPDFYKALYDHNKNDPDNTLYLMHGVWFNEELMYDIGDAYDDEILSSFKRAAKETIDIVHGNSDYTSYGRIKKAVYDKDISKYVIGYILGLEYPSEFVADTNRYHNNINGSDGDYIKTKEDSKPFEAFLCEVGDHLIKYETEYYDHQTPVSFLNWQPLDTLDHPSEPFKEENDSVSVNTENIISKENYYPGLFAAYDVYPYYPDFMSYDYTEFEDNYKAYLDELKAVHTVPLLIAEYGLSTTRGMAHNGINGYKQGNMTENEQGTLLTQMSRDIAQAGCCGGLIFSWQDEWFKRTWNTEVYTPADPNDRTHELSSAEQGYGLLAFDASKACPDGNSDEWNYTTYIENTKIGTLFDAEYLHLVIDLPDGFDFYHDKLYVPISVSGAGSNNCTEYELIFEEYVDYMLIISGKDNTRMLTDANSDVFYYKYSVYKNVFGKENRILYKNNSGIFNRIYEYNSNETYIPTLDKTLQPQYRESGLLKYGNAEEDTLADFYIASDGRLELRIAWYLLGIKNPKLKICIKPTDSKLEYREFDRILIGCGTEGLIKLYDSGFDGLDKIEYKERLKSSYNKVSDVFKEINDAYR
ncbi:MAG: hypothetical protein IJT49_02205 [Clostridia bacterium]|nr:hypothetical protein [Clostridia bacterium]